MHIGNLTHKRSSCMKLCETLVKSIRNIPLGYTRENFTLARLVDRQTCNPEVFSLIPSGGSVIKSCALLHVHLTKQEYVIDIFLITRLQVLCIKI